MLPVLSAPVRPGANLTASTVAPSPSAKRAAAAAALAASAQASSGSDAPLALGDTDVGTREQAEPVKPAPMPLPVSNTDNGPSKDSISNDEVSKLRARLAEAEKIASDLRAELAALKLQQSKSAGSDSVGDQSHVLKTELRDCQRDRDEERRRRSELEHALQQAESEVRTLRQSTPATKSADTTEASSAGPAPRGTTITVQFSRMFAVSVVVLASALAYQSVLSATR
jgi:gas vesicle protein